MLGTVVNALAIIAGSLIGLLVKGGLPERISQTVMQGVGLCVALIGVSGALEGTDYLMKIILFIVAGSLIGAWIDIEQKLENLGDHLEKRFSKSGSSFSKGFVTASLLYCVGAMAIMGSLESGLNGNHEILFAKSILDGIISIVLASTLGITLLASGLTSILTDEVVVQMSATGGLLILGLGLSMILANKVRVGNMLPAVLLPMLYAFVMTFL